MKSRVSRQKDEDGRIHLEHVHLTPITKIAESFLGEKRSEHEILKSVLVIG